MLQLRALGRSSLRLQKAAPHLIQRGVPRASLVVESPGLRMRRDHPQHERRKSQPDVLPSPELLAEEAKRPSQELASLGQQSQGSRAGLLGAYQRALAERPLLTKSLTCFGGSLLGDALAQAAGGAGFDWHRNLSLALYGLLIGGPLGHYWHAYLDRTVAPTRPQSSRAVFGKLALDQLLMAPIGNVLLFAFLECAKGTPEQTLVVVQEKTWGMLRANWMVWPLVQLIAFRYIKQDWRILYANIIGVIWCAYVSLVVFATK